MCNGPALMAWAERHETGMGVRLRHQEGPMRPREVHLTGIGEAGPVYQGESLPDCIVLPQLRPDRVTVRAAAQPSRPAVLRCDVGWMSRAWLSLSRL